MPKNYFYEANNDYLNEQVAEAMLQAHLDEHKQYPDKHCPYCQLDKEAEESTDA